MANNKVNYGLCKMAFAVVTETAGVLTFGTPILLPGAVNMTSAPRGTPQQYEADNIIYFRSNGNEGYTINLELFNVPEEYETSALGMLLDTKKVLVENAYDTVKRIALMGQFEGDVHKKRFVYWYCQPTRPNQDSSTGLKKEPKTKTITFEADPRPDNYDIKASTTSETDSAAYDAWFTAVYEKTVGAG